MSLLIFLVLIFIVFCIWLKEQLTPPWTSEQAQRHIYGGMTREEWQRDFINRRNEKK